MLRKLSYFFLSLVLVASLIFASFYFGTHNKKSDDTKKLQGTVALTEKGLRDVVRNSNLTVYWIGPVAGDLYSIFVPKTGVAVVRYIPTGASVKDTSPGFRLIATYVQKNAFTITRLAGTKKGNLGS